MDLIFQSKNLMRSSAYEIAHVQGFVQMFAAWS